MPPAHASAEDKDRYWLAHVHQGDRVPQLTVRAVAMGAGLGMLMSVSNLYTTLKIGWSFGVAINLVRAVVRAQGPAARRKRPLAAP